MALTLEQKKMLLENQGIVYDVVKKIGVSPSHSNYEDMISLGTIGLIKAIQKFDISGMKFSCIIALMQNT